MADYRLFASREKGSIRQLWSDDETTKPSIYELRPKATRSSQQLQKLLMTDECRSIITALHHIPERIPNSMNAKAFSERSYTYIHTLIRIHTLTYNSTYIRTYIHIHIGKPRRCNSICFRIYEIFRLRGL